MHPAQADSASRYVIPYPEDAVATRVLQRLHRRRIGMGGSRPKARLWWTRADGAWHN